MLEGLVGLFFAALQIAVQIAVVCIGIVIWYTVFQVMQEVDVPQIWEALIYYITVGAEAYKGA